MQRFCSWILLLALSCAAVSCKTSEDARAFAAQMTATAADLHDYYNALAEVVDRHVQLERLQKALLGVPLDEQDLTQLKTAHDELQKRADMAKSLAELAEAFSDLAKSKAPADVSKSAAGLGGELSTIQKLPGSSYAPEVLQHAGELLTKLAQEHDERKMAKDIDPLVAALSEMFSQEKPAYESIHRTYIGLAQSLARELLSRNQVDPASLLAPALKPFGLSPRVPEEKLSPGLEDYAREQIQNRSQAGIAAHASASSDMDQALKELSKHVHELGAGEHLSAQNTTAQHISIKHWAAMIAAN